MDVEGLVLVWIGEVLVAGGEVVMGIVEVTGLLLVDVGVLEEVAVLPAGVRYQFAWGSPRHSPAVTPFQPLAWMSP